MTRYFNRCHTVHFYTWNSNNEIKLKPTKEFFVKLAPTDPRSLIQEDYVILNYEISRTTQKAIKKISVNKIKVVLS